MGQIQGSNSGGETKPQRVRPIDFEESLSMEKIGDVGEPRGAHRHPPNVQAESDLSRVDAS